MTLADPVFLADRLAHWAEVKPDETAVTYLNRSWTWAQWYDRGAGSPEPCRTWGSGAATWCRSSTRTTRPAWS